MILRVGLTGGIASGKTTVGRRLLKLGAVVIDADEIVRELYLPGHSGHEALVARFGDSILTLEGEIDRPRLSSMTLSTPEGAAELNRLIHPLVVAEEERFFQSLDERDEDFVVVIEATLLLEAGGRDRYDRIVVVDTDAEIQIQRACSRGLSEDEARKRMSRQMSRDERLKSADYVIDSSGTKADTIGSTDEIWKKLAVDLADKKNRAPASGRPEQT